MRFMTRFQKSAARCGREKLRFGLVGAGAIAQSYLEALEHCSEAKLVAVADCRFEAARRVAERMCCRAYDRVERMVGDAELDAAIVCTPPITHADICIYLIESGIHTLCEKPFSIGTAQARKMVETAQRTGVKLTMASKFRYVEDIIRAKSLIASGVLGDLILFENVFTQRVDMSSRWNSRPEIGGGGVLIDNGAHSVDLMHYFLGPLAEVHAREGKRCQGLSVEDTVFLFARSAGGVLCNVNLSWSMANFRESFVEIHGTRGAVSIGWRQSARLDFAYPEWIVFGDGYHKIRALRKQVENFSRAIRGEEPLLITPEDALASVAIIERAYEALHQNQGVPIPDTPMWSRSREDIH